MANPWNYIFEDSYENSCCIICGCDNLGPSDVRAHATGRRHANAMAVYGCNIVAQKGKKYYCNLCECLISGYQCVYQHLFGKRHQCILNGSDLGSSDEILDDDAINPWNYVVKVDDTNYNCIICDCDIYGYNSANNHANGMRHSIALDNHGYYISQDGNSYYCELCECHICGYQNIYRHLMGNRHQDLLD